jgi:hypothetical protein
MFDVLFVVVMLMLVVCALFVCFDVCCLFAI